MKRKIFLGLVALALISCDGDNNEVVESASIPTPIPATNLDKVTFKYGGDTHVMEFENNKAQKYYLSYNPDGNYGALYTYDYNADGQLAGMTGKNFAGETTFTRSVVYDEAGRIIAKNDVYYNLLGEPTASEENVTYTYNEDNTVFADFNSYDDTVNDRTYHFNAAGLVETISENEQPVQQILYNGNNVINISNTSYQYDTSTEVKGEYLNIYRNQFNSYSNFVLFTGYMVAQNVAHNYIVKADADYAVGDIDYVYEFNSLGYPVSVTSSSPGSESENTITITYK